MQRWAPPSLREGLEKDGVTNRSATVKVHREDACPLEHCAYVSVRVWFITTKTRRCLRDMTNVCGTGREFSRLVGLRTGTLQTTTAMIVVSGRVAKVGNSPLP